jgi:hypothetical protein
MGRRSTTKRAALAGPVVSVKELLDVAITTTSPTKRAGGRADHYLTPGRSRLLSRS